MAAITPRSLVGRMLGTTISTGIGFAFGGATRDVLSPPMQQLRNEVNERFAYVPLTPQMAAQASIVGAELPEGYVKEAAKSGVNGKRYAALQALAGTGPGWDHLRTLWNRGRVTAAQVDRGLAQTGIRPEWHDDMRSLRWILPTAQELGAMAAQGIIDYDGARGLAADVNANAETFDRYYRLNLTPPILQQLLELRNRGAINDDRLRAGLRKRGYAPEWVDEIASLRRYLLPPSDVIRLAVHEVYSPARRAALNLDAEFPAEFGARAAQVGINEGDARDLWAGHWDLPSYSQGSEMLFRGEISQPEFENLLAALDYAPTWRGKLAAIARRIPTMSDFQRLARREVYNAGQRQALELDAEFPAAFAAKAALHGMSESDARDLWAGGWRLPSAGQGYRMLWRNEIDEPELLALLKALDYSPKWRTKLAAIARPTLGRIDIRRALAAGKLTPAEGIARYRRLGLTQADAELMVSLVTTGSSTTARELTAQQLTTEFEGGFLTAGEYQAELEELKFAGEELAMYLRLGNARRVAAARKQTLATIRSKYVGRHLHEDEARAALELTGIDATTQARIWEEWSQARAANRRGLTPAQIRKLYSNADMTQPEALAALEEWGYRAPDAARFLRL